MDPCVLRQRSIDPFWVRLDPRLYDLYPLRVGGAGQDLALVFVGQVGILGIDPLASAR
jgi:hypothetical protein